MDVTDVDISHPVSDGSPGPVLSTPELSLAVSSNESEGISREIETDMGEQQINHRNTKKLHELIDYQV